MFTKKQVAAAKHVRLASVPEDGLPEEVVEVISVDDMGNLEFKDSKGELSGTALESVIAIID